MENILMTDEMFISLGFIKTEDSTQHSVYWEHYEHLVENSNTILDNEMYQKLISNPFKGNMFIKNKSNVSGYVYDSRLQIRVYPSAQPYRLIDVINGMNLFLKANYIERGKEKIINGMKSLLKLNE